MDTKVQDDKREPLTYANAPSYVENGIEYVDADAVVELTRGAAAKYAGLLERLAKE